MSQSSPGQVPKQLGRYELVRKIATGGMATVHLGRMLSKGAFERSVAIKILHEEMAADPSFVAMFLDEARLSARIRHPNVVDVYDVDSEKGVLYIVMQYIEGASLADLADTAERKQIEIPHGIAAKIMFDALSGLHAAHELKDAEGHALDIIHRDVSPQNLLVGLDGSTRVTDFGVAKSRGRLATTSTRNIVKGKERYLAPEQMQSELPIDRRVDVFAAGIVLWELLAGRALFAGDSFPDTLAAILTQPIPRPGVFASDLPRAIEDVCMKALERKRELRYATAGDFADALEAAAENTLATPKVVAKFMKDLAPSFTTKGGEAPPVRGTSDPSVRAEVAALTPSKDLAPRKLSFQKAAPLPARRVPAAPVAPAKGRPLNEDATEIRPTPGIAQSPKPAPIAPRKFPPAPVAATPSLADESDDPPTHAMELSPAAKLPQKPGAKVAVVSTLIGKRPAVSTMLQKPAGRSSDMDDVPTRIAPPEAAPAAVAAATGSEPEPAVPLKRSITEVIEVPPPPAFLAGTPAFLSPPAPPPPPLDEATEIDGGQSTAIMDVPTAIKSPAKTTAVMELPVIPPKAPQTDVMDVPVVPDALPGADDDGSPTKIRTDGAAAALAHAGIAVPATTGTDVAVDLAPASSTDAFASDAPVHVSDDAIEVAEPMVDPQRKARVRMIAIGSAAAVGLIGVIALIVSVSGGSSTSATSSAQAQTTAAPKPTAPVPASTPAAKTSEPAAAAPTTTAEAQTTSEPAPSAAPTTTAEVASTGTAAGQRPPPGRWPPPPSKPPPGKTKQPPKYVP